MIFSKKQLNYKYFHYVMYILNIVKFICLKTQDQVDKANYFLIGFYLNMLKLNSYLRKVNNLWSNYTNEEVYKCIYKHFIALNKTDQQIIYEEIITHKPINAQTQFDILKHFQDQGLNYKAFSYKLLFEKIIMDHKNIEQYRKYYYIMMALLNNDYEFKYCDESKGDIINIFETYLNHLENLSNNEDYILLNKLQIINNIYDQKNDNQCHFYRKTLSGLIIDKNRNIIIAKSRLKSNDKYNEIVTDIWKKIYSNIQIPFNDRYDYSNFIPIDIIELKYDLNEDKPNTEE